MRAESDAIIVGITTALRDDPSLTVRLDTPWPREPYRVVLDTTPAVSRGARDPRRDARPGSGAVGRRPRRPCGGAAGGRRHRRAVPESRRSSRRERAARALFDLEARAVLVEGGGEVHAAFLDAGLVDRVALFVAPMLVGGRAARAGRWRRRSSRARCGWSVRW